MDYWLRFLFWGEGVHVSAWLFLEVTALATLQGRSRAYALATLPAMALLGAATARSYLAGSFNWPLLLTLVSPPVAFVTGVLVFRGVQAQAHPAAKRIQYLVVAVLVASFLVGVLRYFA